MSRSEEFVGGAQRTPDGWVRVRANTVYGNPKRPPVIAVPHEDGHVVGHAIDHESDSGFRSLAGDRAFAIRTESGEVKVASVPKRAWIFHQRPS